MDIQFVAVGSSQWIEARALRYSEFFEPLALPQSIMDDDEESKGIHLVAIDRHNVVGYGRLFDRGNGEFHLSQLVVSPHHRGTGIGHTLLQTLISRAHSAGGKRVKLKARLSAAGFYAAAGFHREGDTFASEKTGIPHVNMVRTTAGGDD